MKVSLVVTQGKPEGKEIPIRLSQFIIGRDPECHLRPANGMISKRHCAVLVRDGKVYLRDFESTNGTVLNQQPLKGEQEVKNGDEFKVGPLGFRVKIMATVDAPKAAAAAPAPKPAVAALAATKKPDETMLAISSKVDEDSVMEMLLNLEGAAARVEGAEDPIPGGSTIMQLTSASSGTGDDPAETKSPTAKDETSSDQQAAKTPAKKAGGNDPHATSNAAKAILDKYMRRPRS